MRRIVLILLGLVVAASLSSAQNTKILGTVFDAEDGSPIPYAAVVFEGTTIGVATDSEGRFSLSTTNTSLTVLHVQQLGYVPVDIKIKAGTFNSLRIVMHQDRMSLKEVVVKADNSKIKRLLARVDSAKLRNDPDHRDQFKCEAYTKLEVGITNPKEQLKGRRGKKEWKFVWNYIDTSDVSGIPYLPVILNESVATRYRVRSPLAEREVIHASKMSGNTELEGLLNQFSGSIHFKANFYNQFINAFDVHIPSPVSSGGLMYYNYFIVDSLQMDSRKTYLVRYHPKPMISSPAFDGEMLIDAGDYALAGIKARLVKGQNINWVRDIMLESSYTRLEDSTWFYKSNRFYADFAFVPSDSSKIISFIGNRVVDFGKPEFEHVDLPHEANVTTVAEDASDKPEEYWVDARPRPLSFREKNIYMLSREIEKTTGYQAAYNIVSIIVNGYYDHGPVGYGPVLNFLSFNPLEGFRMRFGVRTTTQVSRKNRYMGYVAFGCKDLQVKGGAQWEHLFSKYPFNKLTLDIHYDTFQLGKGNGMFNDGNILSSLLGGGFTGKLCPELQFSTTYEHEFAGWANAIFDLRYREFYGNHYVPMSLPTGEIVHSVPSVQAAAEIRFSKDETVLRGNFMKTYAETKFPVVTIGFKAGVAGLNMQGTAIGAYALGKGAMPYFIPELKLVYNTNVGPVGKTRLNFNAGTIVGKVPYTHLHLHEGNGSFMLDKTAFSTMDFFEFASDTWVTLRWEHNFQGFFLGKIPYLKKLQLREALIFKGTWGYLSENNQGSAMLLPEHTHSMGNVPYIEVGFGITNILRIFRVDFLWRATHREDYRQHPRNFVVNLGVELNF